MFDEVANHGRGFLQLLDKTGRTRLRKDRFHHELDSAHEQWRSHAGEKTADYSQNKPHAVGLGQRQNLPNKRNQMHNHMIWRSYSILASLYRPPARPWQSVLLLSLSG